MISMMKIPILIRFVTIGATGVVLNSIVDEIMRLALLTLIILLWCLIVVVSPNQKQEEKQNWKYAYAGRVVHERPEVLCYRQIRLHMKKQGMPESCRKRGQHGVMCSVLTCAGAVAISCILCFWCLECLDGYGRPHFLSLSGPFDKCPPRQLLQSARASCAPGRPALAPGIACRRGRGPHGAAEAGGFHRSRGHSEEARAE